MATWPAEITITRRNYRERPPNNVIRSNMDLGPDKIRRRSSANVRLINLSLFLTPEQVDILDEFYNTYDAGRFDFVHPRTEETVQARFVTEPEYALNETMYDVAVQLEILP